MYNYSVLSPRTERREKRKKEKEKAYHDGGVVRAPHPRIIDRVMAKHVDVHNPAMLTQLFRALLSRSKR
jgi:hypothetical protein